MATTEPDKHRQLWKRLCLEYNLWKKHTQYENMYFFTDINVQIFILSFPLLFLQVRH